MALPNRPTFGAPACVAGASRELPKGLNQFLRGEPFLLAVDKGVGLIRVGDDDIVTGLLQPDGSYRVDNLLSPPCFLRPLTQADLVVRRRSVDELLDRFHGKLDFWAGMPALQVPRVCEPLFEEAAVDFRLLDVPGSSRVQAPLYREEASSPQVGARVYLAEFPAFQMAEATDGYTVHFGHLRPAQGATWELHNHTYGARSIVTADTYFKHQTRPK